MTKHSIGMVTRNTPCLEIVIFSDETVKMKFSLLCLDRYLFSVESVWVVAIDIYPDIVMKIYFLLLLLGM